MNRIPIADFLPGVMQQFPLDKDTILVGHSAGAPLILALLEKSNQKIHKAVFVAGFSEQLAGDPDLILQESYDWQKIKEHAHSFIIFNSDNDPWGCDDGHFGSITMNQPYKDFPELLSEVLS